MSGKGRCAWKEAHLPDTVVEGVVFLQLPAAACLEDRTVEIAHVEGQGKDALPPVAAGRIVPVKKELAVRQTPNEAQGHIRSSCWPRLAGTEVLVRDRHRSRGEAAEAAVDDAFQVGLKPWSASCLDSSLGEEAWRTMSSSEIALQEARPRRCWKKRRLVGSFRNRGGLEGVGVVLLLEDRSGNRP